MNWFKFVREEKEKPTVADPPPTTAWAQLIEANKAKRAEYNARKQAILDAEKMERESIWRRTRVQRQP